MEKLDFTDIQRQKAVSFYAKLSHSSTEEESESCAKQVDFETASQYFIKKNRNGHFFDPYDYDHTHARRNTFAWKKVKKEAFDYYLTYINKGSTTMLHYAERVL